MLRSVKTLYNYTVSATDGDVGKVYSFYFDDHAWAVRYLVIKVDVIGRKVLISPVAIDNLNQPERKLSILLSKYEVKYSPDINFDKPISRQQETKLHDQYGWPMYWLNTLTPDLRAVGLHPHTLARVITGRSAKFKEQSPLVINSQDLRKVDVPNNIPQESAAPDESYKGNPRLRSTKELIGYRIQAKDGKIGHVDDFIVDDETWSIPLMVIDTRHWLPGGKVLASPLWVEIIHWAGARIYMNLKRQTIRECPEYDPEFSQKSIKRSNNIFKAM